MFYKNDNKFVCSHVLIRIVDKYLHIHTITGLALETLTAPVELLNASLKKVQDLYIYIHTHLLRLQHNIIHHML